MDSEVRGAVRKSSFEAQVRFRRMNGFGEQIATRSPLT